MDCKLLLAAICLAVVFSKGEAAQCYGCMWFTFESQPEKAENKVAVAGIIADHNTEQVCSQHGADFTASPSRMIPCSGGCVKNDLRMNFALAGETVTATLVSRGCATGAAAAATQDMCTNEVEFLEAAFRPGTDIESGTFCMCSGELCNGSSHVVVSLTTAIIGLLGALLF